MKTRNALVSNSSSSSFIIIGRSPSDDLVNQLKESVKNTIVIDDKGTTEFGWDNIKYDNFWDRLNFTMIQIMSPYWKIPEEYKNSDHYKLLQKVLKDVLDVDNIDNKLSYDYGNDDDTIYSYIDHQSNINEGRNGEMFNSEDDLKAFLFSNDSYIQGGNDNE